MNTLHRIQAMTDGIAEGIPLDELAKRSGVPLGDLELWQALYGAAQADLARRQSRQGRRLKQAGLVLAAMVVLAGSWATAQATCTQTLPSPLTTFCPNAPAVAGAINGNFQQLVDWLQLKVGTVGNNNVTTGTLTASSVSASTVTASGGVRSFALDNSSGTLLRWNLTGGVGETDLINYRGLGGGGVSFYNASSTSGATTLLTSIDSSGRIHPTNGIAGSGKLCIVTTNCDTNSAFTCGNAGSCGPGKVLVGVKDGTGCGITNVLTCCNLELSDSCP